MGNREQGLRRGGGGALQDGGGSPYPEVTLGLRGRGECVAAGFGISIITYHCQSKGQYDRQRSFQESGSPSPVSMQIVVVEKSATNKPRGSNTKAHCARLHNKHSNIKSEPLAYFINSLTNHLGSSASYLDGI